MRFLDVCHNPEAMKGSHHPVPYLLVVQGDHVDVRGTRVVVPLVRTGAAGIPVSGLMPVFTVNGIPVVMMTPQIAGIPITQIGEAVANLSGHHHEIRQAIDILTGDV